MDKLQATHSDMDFEVIADETTGDGGFKISWDNGGALYDTPSIAQKILGNLDEILADQGLTSHDKCEEDSKVSSEMTDVGSGNTDNDDPTVEDNHDG